MKEHPLYVAVLDGRAVPQFVALNLLSTKDRKLGTRSNSAGFW